MEIDAGTRTVFSYVPQGNMIMSGTIRENITFCNPKVTDEEIQRAARAACIWDYIETLPNGLDTVYRSVEKDFLWDRFNGLR